MYNKIVIERLLDDGSRLRTVYLVKDTELIREYFDYLVDARLEFAVSFEA